MSFAPWLFRLRWGRRLLRRPVRRPTGRRRRFGTPGRWRRSPLGSLRVRWPRGGWPEV